MAGTNPIISTAGNRNTSTKIEEMRNRSFGGFGLGLGLGLDGQHHGLELDPGHGHGPFLNRTVIRMRAIQ